MCVNDVVRAASCDLYLHAGDSALLISGKGVDEMESKLSYELGHAIVTNIAISCSHI